MPNSVSVNVTVSGSFLSPEEVNKALHAASDELGDMEVGRVLERTPRDTGALRDSLSYRPYPNPKSKQLVKLWFDDEPQLFEWGRVYDPYQEGPPLGLSTYTNPPHQMLYLAETEDASAIQAWADEAVRQAETEAEAHLLDGMTLDEFIANMGTL